VLFISKVAGRLSRTVQSVDQHFETERIGCVVNDKIGITTGVLSVVRDELF
jgi:hypothetical protein